jgi:hypothetical protein
MFRKNEDHRQQSYFSGAQLLPEYLRERLEESWAGTFYREVFCRIDEEVFAVLYSGDKASRPNVPVNVLMGVDILKSGFGWSDDELLEQVSFNLQVRYALGLNDLRAAVFTLRTLYNFRRRVREYAAQTGINLYQHVFECVTDEQLAAVEIATGWQRMDSTQVLSNLANWSRLELLVAVVQEVHEALGAAVQEQWAEMAAPYLRGRPHQVSYRLKSKDTGKHLQRLGEILAAWEQELAQMAPTSAALALVQRVLAEQYNCTESGAVRVRPAAEVPSDSLQSPHDPEATYRVKGGQAYRGGYVANVSETADPENAIQLLTDLQVAPNITDDAQLLRRSLARQAARNIAVHQVTGDGGYSGPQAEAACAEHEVALRPTRLRGGRSGEDTWGGEAYTWEVNAAGCPLRVTCPAGHTAEIAPARKPQRYIARFARQTCETCPYFKEKCRVKTRMYKPPSLYVTQRAVTVARQRQQLCPEDRRIRAVVEATVRSLKHAFPTHKLPVRGLTRVRMLLYGAALMVNMRRLHRHAEEKKQNAADNAFSFLSHALYTLWQALSALHLGFQRLAAPLGVPFAFSPIPAFDVYFS